MIRMTVIAMTFGLLAGTACKKKSDTSAGEAAKTQATTGTTKDTTTPATGATAEANAGVTAGGIERAADEGAAAMLAQATGTVEVRRLGEPTWAAAKADTKLYAGDQVRTADASGATIMLADQSVIEVAEASTVAVASRDASADPASAAAVLSGNARFSVTPRAPGEGAFRVYTPGAVVLTKGTTYGIGVAASGEARVGVESGSVEVIGLAALDAQPIEVATATQVVIAADGKVGSTSAWATDDWGTWRDEADATVEVGGSIKAHGDALAELDAALNASYTELQANADSAVTFEATAAGAAEKNDTAAYTAALPDGAATIDASFSLAGRLEALTWAHAGHATLATDLYVRHPEAQAQWDVVAPRVDASILWPKRFEVTATAYWQPLRMQYYVHHPVGRANASLVGITVPTFYASVQPPAVEPATVRAKVKGQIWVAPTIAWQASTRPLWIANPNANWHASAKVNAAPPRAKVAWYVRPATLKSKAYIGAPIKGSWATKMTVAAPQPRAAFAASWKIPVGTKIKVDAPNFDAAAKARATAKFEAPNMKVNAPNIDVKGAANAKMDTAVDAKAKINGKVNVAVPQPQVVVPSVDVKGKAGAAANAGADVKTKVDGAVKAKADVKIKAPEVKPPAVKVDVKAKASGGFKLGN